MTLNVKNTVGVTGLSASDGAFYSYQCSDFRLEWWLSLSLFSTLFPFGVSCRSLFGIQASVCDFIDRMMQFLYYFYGVSKSILSLKMNSAQPTITGIYKHVINKEPCFFTVSLLWLRNTSWQSLHHQGGTKNNKSTKIKCGGQNTAQLNQQEKYSILCCDQSWT